jgi:sulfur-carrier protein
MARLVFLGRLADVAGKGEAEFGFSSPLDWPDVIAWLEDAFSVTLAESVLDPRVRLAVNGQLLADRESLILDNSDELAFLPPVSGG